MSFSRKQVLLMLSSAALAGCSGSSILVPKPRSLLSTPGAATVICPPSACDPGGGGGGGGGYTYQGSGLTSDGYGVNLGANAPTAIFSQTFNPDGSAFSQSSLSVSGSTFTYTELAPSVSSRQFQVINTLPNNLGPGTFVQKINGNNITTTIQDYKNVSAMFSVAGSPCSLSIQLTSDPGIRYAVTNGSRQTTSRLIVPQFPVDWGA